MKKTSQRFERALAAATRMTAGLLSGDEPGALVQSILESALELVEGEVAAVALFEDDPSSLLVRASAGPVDIAGKRVPVAGTVLGAVASTGRAEVVSDVAADARRGTVLEQARIARAVVAPLRVSGRVLGAILVGQRKPAAVHDDEADLGILSMFAELAAGALHTERTLSEERTFSTRLAALSARIAHPQSCWDRTPLAEVIRDCAWILGADAAALAELGDDGSYRLVEGWRIDPELLERWRMPAKAADRLLGADGLGRVLNASAAGFRGWAQDLYADVPRGATTMRLHALCAEGRGFRSSEVRLASVVGVQLGGLLDRLELYREVRQSMDAQQRASQRLRELYDDIDEGIVVLDKLGRVTFASRRAYHVLRTTPQELLERGVFRFAEDDDQPALLRAFAQALDGARIAGELHAPHGATMRTIAFTLRPEATDDANAAVRMVLTDVTEARHREADTLHREKLASVGVLAAGIAHEINNPLAFVLGNHRYLAQRLSDLEASMAAHRSHVPQAELAAMESELSSLGVSDLFPDIRSLLDDSLEGLERVRRIVGDLRLFARKDPEAPGELDVRGLVESAVGMAAPAVRMRATLLTEIAEDLPAPVGWNGLLGQAILNLVVNAAQAIPEGDPAGNRVEVRAWIEAGALRISVRDTGAGIAPEIRTKLFTPFFTTKSPREGTGLGLAIAYDAVRRHGGRIEVDSDPGRGSTFTIVLPAPGEDTQLTA